jgi:hypothetical protein
MPPRQSPALSLRMGDIDTDVAKLVTAQGRAARPTGRFPTCPSI